MHFHEIPYYIENNEYVVDNYDLSQVTKLIFTEYSLWINSFLEKYENELFNLEKIADSICLENHCLTFIPQSVRHVITHGYKTNRINSLISLKILISDNLQSPQELNIDNDMIEYLEFNGKIYNIDTYLMHNLKTLIIRENEKEIFTNSTKLTFLHGYCGIGTVPLSVTDLTFHVCFTDDNLQNLNLEKLFLIFSNQSMYISLTNNTVKVLVLSWNDALPDNISLNFPNVKNLRISGGSSNIKFIQEFVSQYDKLDNLHINVGEDDVFLFPNLIVDNINHSYGTIITKNLSFNNNNVINSDMSVSKIICECLDRQLIVNNSYVENLILTSPVEKLFLNTPSLNELSIIPSWYSSDDHEISIISEFPIKLDKLTLSHTTIKYCQNVEY